MTIRRRLRLNLGSTGTKPKNANRPAGALTLHLHLFSYTPLQHCMTMLRVVCLHQFLGLTRLSVKLERWLYKWTLTFEAIVLEAQVWNVFGYNVG